MTAAVDKDVLKEVEELMDDAFLELLTTFLRDTRQRMQNMQTALQQKNLDELRISSHTIKSSSANLGALALSTTMEAIEAVVKDGKLEGVPELFEQSKQQFTEVLLYFRQHYPET